MAEMNDSEKTEEPTPQRREDFRNRGQVAQTRELGSVFVLLFSTIAFWLLGRFFFFQIYEVYTRSFTDFVVQSSRHGDWYMAVRFAAIHAALIVAPLTGLLWIINIMATSLGATISLEY